MELHEKLKQLRMKNGYSQIEVANFIGVTRQAISKWENGGSQPDIENLSQLARLYDVSLKELLNGPKHKISDKRWTFMGIVCLVLSGGFFYLGSQMNPSISGKVVQSLNPENPYGIEQGLRMNVIDNKQFQEEKAIDLFPYCDIKTGKDVIQSLQGYYLEDQFYFQVELQWDQPYYLFFGNLPNAEFFNYRSDLNQAKVQWITFVVEASDILDYQLVCNVALTDEKIKTVFMNCYIEQQGFEVMVHEAQ